MSNNTNHAKAAATAIIGANKAADSIWMTWADTYLAVSTARHAGVKAADIANETKAQGGKVSATTVDDMATAHGLTTRGVQHYRDAIETVFGEGAVKYAHTLVCDARKAIGSGGTEYVRQTLAPIAEADSDDVALAVLKAVKELKAKANGRKAGGKTDQTEDAPADYIGEGEGGEGDGPDERTPAQIGSDDVTAILGLVRGLTKKLRKGEATVSAGARQDMESAIRDLAAAVKAQPAA